MNKSLPLTFHPLTIDRWGDFERLFGLRGAVGGCWCMWWRLRRSEFDLLKGEGNKSLMQSIVASGEVPGILAYDGDQPVGWCSLGPRASYEVLLRSRVLKAVDELPVWSVVCFFIARSYRRQGVSEALLAGALEYARSQGATVVEGYPIVPKNDQMPDVFLATGMVSTFQSLGFHEVARRSERRPIMRYFFDQVG